MNGLTGNNYLLLLFNSEIGTTQKEKTNNFYYYFKMLSVCVHFLLFEPGLIGGYKN